MPNKIKKRTIGRRLISAIVLMAFLTIIVSLIAAINWGNLSTQITVITNNNMPTLRASYQLERNTAKLQSTLNELTDNYQPIRHNILKQKITVILADISAAINNTETLHYYPMIKSGQHKLAMLIENYTLLLEQRNTQQLAITHSEDSIKALHRNLNQKLTPLRQEIEGEITEIIDNTSENTVLHSETINKVMYQLSVIQSLTVKENHLYQLIKEAIKQRNTSNIDTEFTLIEQKALALNKLSEELNNNTSSNAYHDLLSQLVAQIKLGSQLEQQLKQNVATHSQILRTQSEIKNGFIKQENIIQDLVKHANSSLKQLNTKTQHSILVSNFILFGVIFITILLTAILSVYLVGHGIVKRLTLLGNDLYAVANGDLNAKIRTTGNDEIGMLGENLRYFCQQMQTLQTTNALNLINNTQASIITCDLEGIIESVNPQALTLFDFESIPENQTLWALFEPDMYAKLHPLFAPNSPLLHSGAYKITVNLLNAQSGQLYLRLDFRLFKQGNNDKVIITITDITEQEKTTRWLESKVAEKTHSLTLRNRQLNAEIEDRKRIEADLIATQDDLIQAAKMAVVGQTMTSLAHELNQPLSAISTRVFSAKLAIESQKYDKLPECFSKIENLITRMSMLITNLRNFAKKQSATKPLTQVDIQDSIKQAMFIVESRTKIQKTNIHNLITTPLYAQADQIQLEQVLVNLLVNSCDAVAGCDQRDITIMQLEHPLPSNRVRIAIIDSGDGFDETIIKKLFIPFTTTKDVGIGIGLTICHSIMSRFNGEIFLASGINRGAMVVLELNKDDK